MSSITERVSKPNGFLLVQVLIVTVIASIAALAIGHLIINFQMESNNLKFRTEGNVLNEEIRALLSDPEACTQSFGGLILSTSANVATSVLKNSAGEMRYSEGQTYGDSSILIDGFTLSNYLVGPVSGKAEARLATFMRSYKSSAGAQIISRSIQLSLDVDSGGKILNCIALAKMSDGIWQRSSADLGSIYYQASAGSGMVGIGTENPATTLDVHGGIRVGTENTVVTCNQSVEGQIRYNSLTKKIDYCDGASWRGAGMPPPNSYARVSNNGRFCNAYTDGSGNVFMEVDRVHYTGGALTVRTGAWAQTRQTVFTFCFNTCNGANDGTSSFANTICVANDAGVSMSTSYVGATSLDFESNNTTYPSMSSPWVHGATPGLFF